MKGQTYVIISIVLIILVAVFAVTNVDAVEVNYLFWVVESPLILVILFSVLMGGLLVAAAGSVRLYQLKKEMKELHKQLEQTKGIISEKTKHSNGHQKDQE
ncbi:MAG TPA: lipopolysaccharide assembly protein LapA domain-containing protein [Bacillota bacterium]|nr:lipopolysaccharide assembly protein LapA domain-containing protein [Bacillota bacterium]